MIKALVARFQQGHRTMRYPKAPAPALPPHFKGLPRIEAGACELCGPRGEAEAKGLCAAIEVCPTEALRADSSGTLSLDLGRCLFCGACEGACEGAGQPGAIVFGRDHRLATRSREELLLAPGSEGLALARALEGRIKSLLGRSLKLREVSAGGCNACEADVNVLNTVGWDLGRFGIQFVASPRHADGLLLTGPVTANMELALKKTWDAIPGPKIAIAVGACALSGGPYAGAPEVLDGAGRPIPVDLYIPGCPPHPLTILDGLLRLIGKLDRRGEGAQG